MSSNTNVRADVIEVIDPVYGILPKNEPAIDTYYRSVGSNSSRWIRTLSQAPTYTNGKITFSDSYRQYFYKLSNMFVRLTFTIQRQAPVPPTLDGGGAVTYLNGGLGFNTTATTLSPLTRAYIALIPCFLATTLSIVISGQEMNQTGSKTYLYKLAYLLKLFKTDSRFIDGETIKWNQGFFVSKGLGGFDIKPNQLWLEANTSLADIANFDAGKDIYSVNPPANNGTALGNGAIQETANPYFNRGFFDACRLYYNACTTSTVSTSLVASTNIISNIVLELPLADYCPLLASLQSVYTGFQMNIEITLPEWGEMFLNPNTQAQPGGGNAPAPLTGVNAGIIVIPNNGAELWIQSFDPSNETRIELYKEINTSVVKRVKYIDWDVYRSQILKLNNNSQNNIQFNNILNRKPVAVFFGFQNVDLFGQQYANPNLYMNIMPSSVQLQLGQAQLFPKYPILTYPANGDYTALYKELLKTLDINPSNGGPVRNIDYVNYINNLFLLAFDLRDIEPSTFSINNPSSLTLFTDLNLNTTYPGGGSYNNDLYAASQNGTVVYNAQQLQGGIPQPDLPPNGLYCWCYVASERTVEIRYSPNGVSFKVDVIDDA